MSHRELVLLLVLSLAAGLVVFGVSMWSLPAAVVLSGVLVAVLGVLVLGDDGGRLAALREVPKRPHVRRHGRGFTQPVSWLSSPWWGGLAADRESIEADFESYCANVFKESGPVFGTILVRHLVFSEAEFLWRDRMANGATVTCSATRAGVVAASVARRDDG